jgi:hypothetical protein
MVFKWSAFVVVFSLTDEIGGSIAAMPVDGSAPTGDQQLFERDMGSSSFGFSTAAWSAIGEPVNIGTVHGVGDDVRGIARA